MIEKFVYFLRPIGQIGPIKIGCSRQPEWRLENYLPWSPVKLEIVAAIPGTHAQERKLHSMFDKDWMHHEWFGASKELLALIDHVLTFGCLPELPQVIKFPVRPRQKRLHNLPPRPKTGPSEKTVAFGHLIKADYESGTATADLAETHGRSESGVRYALKAVGVKLRRGRPLIQLCERGVEDTERANEFERRYLGGETLEAIAKDHGITRERVRQILRMYGVPSRGFRKAPVRPITPEQKRMADLYLAGVPVKELEASFSCCLPTALEKAGVRPGRMDAYRATIKERDEAVAAAYLRGESVNQIAKANGLSHGTAVYRSLKRLGIEPDRPVFGCAAA